MRGAWWFAVLAGCSFDYGALSGTGPDDEDYQDYRDVVDTCASGWSRVLGDTFDDPGEELEDRWELPTALGWRIDEDALVGQLPKSGFDYWTPHIVARDLAARDMWMRADVLTGTDQYPLLQARIDPEASDRRFYGLRLRGDLAGIEIFFQEQAENLDCSVSPSCETVYFDETLAVDVMVRLVLTVRTDGGVVRVTGGVYALDAEEEPGLDPVGDVTRAYMDDEAFDLAGAVGLSAWQGQVRFDNVFVFACD